MDGHRLRIRTGSARAVVAGVIGRRTFSDDLMTTYLLDPAAVALDM